MKFNSLALSLLVLLFSTSLLAAEITAVIQPEGDVETSEQLQVRFSEPMIILGDDNDHLVPVESDCVVGGSGYWTDEKSWVYTYRSQPEPGKVCQIKIKPDLKSTVSQNKVKASTTTFKTLSAQIISLYPEYYSSVDPEQYFIIRLNGKPDLKWVKENVYFTIKGLGDKVPAIILSEFEKKRALEAVKLSSNYWWRQQDFDKNMDRTLVVKADRVFPRDQSIQFFWHKSFEYSVTAPFKVQFNCERESAQSACVPLSTMYLSFTESVPATSIKDVFLTDEAGNKIYAQEAEKLSPKGNFSSLNFRAPFKPQHNYQVNIKGIKSISGEKLTNVSAFPLKISTADFPALLKVDRYFSVIEASHPVLPITLRNIENPLPALNYTKALAVSGNKVVLDGQNVKKIIEVVTNRNRYESNAKNIVAGLKPFKYEIKKTLKNNVTEVIGVPLKEKGLHFFEFKSRILGKNLNYKPEENPEYIVKAAALVTNIGLTLKFSKADILVWATSLDKGEPLKNLALSIYNFKGEKVKEFKTNDQGWAYAELSKADVVNLNPTVKGYYGDQSYFVFAQKGDDFSFVRSSDREGLESYRFGLSLPYSDEEIIHHAILEKSLLRPNEMVKAKLVYRKVEAVGLSIPTVKLPESINIVSQLDEKKFSVPVKWDKTTGTGLIEWKIPMGATLGSYGLGDYGSFSVEEFKTPSMLTRMNALGAPWVNERNPKIEFDAQYFNGGPVAALPVKIRYSLQADNVSISDSEYSEYNWQSGTIKEGMTKQESADSDESQQTSTTNQIDLKLDQQGHTQFILPQMKYTNTPQQAVVTAEYKDANGDIQTMTRAYSLWSSKALIGVKAKSWYQTVEAFDFEAALLDLKNNPLMDKWITLTAYKVNNFSTRKKLIGGFYSYESFEEVKKDRELCRVKTNRDGKISCHTSDKKLSGDYVVVASYKDEEGVVISSRTSSYVAGESWYGGSNSDRMDLIPFKKSYEPGEVAEFQVRGPITEGELLVTVERGKILSQFVQKFSATQPNIKIKIEKNWSPNIVVSAVLVRGRIAGAISGLLDLGKPSLKMGMTSIKVGIKRHILNVTVIPNKEIFQPREQVTATIKVTDDNNLPVNGEIAVAAVDEALLALQANNSWNLLESLIQPRAHKVETAYMMSQVLGKRTLGLKAVPAGGDGGGAASRELFDTSLFWNPKVVVKNGEAQVKFKANDALSSFKIVAIAISGAEQFGTGSSAIKITKDIQATSSLALAVRKKDNYLARFNVRNSTAAPANLKAVLILNKNKLSEQKLSLKPNEAQELSWAITAPTAGFQEFELQITQDGKMADVLKVKQEVQEVWSLRSMGSSFKQDINLSVPVMPTPEASQSLVQITALPSLASPMPGLQKFWELYPYDCFEQRLSRAISLNSERLFKDLMKVSDLYLDGQGLVKFFPASRVGSLFLTNYVLQIIKQKGWKPSIYLQENSLPALRKFFDGRLNQQEISDPKYREWARLETLDTLTMYGQHKPEDYASLKLDRLEMLTNNYLAHVISIMNGDKTIPQQAEIIKQTLQILRSRTVLTSGRLTLKDAVAESMSRYYVFDDMSLAKVLNQILKTPEFKDDGGRLILSFIEMMKSGSWYNTMSNAWGVVTLQTYKNEFEKIPVKGEIKWGLSGEELKKVNIETKNVEDRFTLKKSTQVVANFNGAGKPWWSILVLSDAPVTRDRMHGINVEKTWKPIQVKNESQKNVGDIWEISLKLISKSDFQWLAVRDPLPPGAVVISDDAYLSEKKALEYRAYEPWFSEGERTFTYRVRLNQPGTFTLPTTRAEAMYDPDNFGEKVNGEFKILP